MSTKRLFIMVTNGPENAELATIPFVMATAAQASDVEVLMGFQGNGSMLMLKSMPGHVTAQGFPRLKELIDIYSKVSAMVGDLEIEENGVLIIKYC